MTWWSLKLCINKCKAASCLVPHAFHSFHHSSHFQPGLFYIHFFFQNYSDDIYSLCFKQNWNAKAAAVIRSVTWVTGTIRQNKEIAHNKELVQSMREDGSSDTSRRPEFSGIIHFISLPQYILRHDLWVEMGKCRRFIEWQGMTPTPFLFCINHLEYQLNVQSPPPNSKPTTREQIGGFSSLL